MYQLIRSRTTRALGAMAAALLLVAPGLVAQTGSITGRITDSQSGQPIGTAQVFIADLDVGALTQQNGSYSLEDVPAGTQTVTVQRLGYQEESAQVTVTAGQATVQNFSIDQTALQLDEVIVTGTAGGSQRRALGNSVERLDAAAVTERAAIGNLQDLLTARTPGLRFQRQTGQVGAGSGIQIRGVNSLSLGNNPLIYVDGIRMDNDPSLGPSSGSGSNQSAFMDINPEEIESVEVIKGPAAATLYGTEASAGVIQIITKRGEVGAPEFTFETTQGTNFMVDPAGKLGTQYGCAVAAAQCPEESIRPVNLYEEANDFLRREGRFAGFSGPVRDSDLFGYGYSQRYNLSVRGGTDQVRYYLAGAWSDDTGMLDYNTDTSTNLRANVTVLLSESLNLDISTGYTQGLTRNATVDEEGSVWHQLVWGSPNCLPGLRTEAGCNTLGWQERLPYSYEDTDITREYSRFTGSMTATHTFSDWLSQRLTVGVDRAWDTNTEYLPDVVNYNVEEVTRLVDFGTLPGGGVNYERPIVQNLTFDYGATGDLALTESLGSSTSVGARYYSRLSENFSSSGLGFATPVQTTINQADDTSIDYDYVENKTLGFYIQEELNWENRIFVTAAVSADDNSAFGGEFDLVYYPKVSGAWVISEEDFWNVDFINSLRLRGAYGESGRQPDTFASQTIFSTYPGPNGRALVATTAGNQDIGPEVSAELELGFEIAMLDDRLSGEFNYYTTTTSDALLNQPLSPSEGLPGSRDANLGEVKSWGWEASVDARLWASESATFDLNFAADYTSNEITSLGEIPPSGALQLGMPYPANYSPFIIESAQFDDDLNPINLMCDEGRPVTEGGPNILQGGDIVPCNEVSSNPGLFLGPTYPEYTFRIGPTLTLWDTFQVFALAEGQHGRWVDSIDANYACRFYQNCLAQVRGDDPVFEAAISGASIDERYNGHFLGDFWKLREIGARYTLPQTLVSRVGADRASISVSGRNLWTIWQKNDTDLAGNPIYDPESAINGGTALGDISLWELPPMANLSATLRVTF